jgi:hypothetical protein
MPIPKVAQNEPEEEFISRCMSAISDEYDNKQSYAICKNEIDKLNGVNLNKWRKDFMSNTNLEDSIRKIYSNKNKTNI